MEPGRGGGEGERGERYKKRLKYLVKYYYCVCNTYLLAIPTYIS
jgi:hypothetical protein